MNRPTRTTVAVMVRNMDAAIQFYTEVMGMELKQRYGDHYAEITTPNMDIGLHPASAAKTVVKLRVPVYLRILAGWHSHSGSV